MVSGKRVEHAEPAKADMFAIGTILKKERKARFLGIKRRLHIWGSGAGDKDERFDARHHYHAVRGTLTRGCIVGGADSSSLGDPGLLASRYWDGRPRPEKKYSVGIIPHFVDATSPAVKQLLNIKGAHLIDVFSPVDEVLEQVQQCHYILSSSMHGLIVSDAFNVPNRRIVFSSKVKSNMKFADYYSAFGLQEPTSLVLGEHYPHDPELLVGDYSTKQVDSVCDRLISSFPDI